MLRNMMYYIIAITLIILTILGWIGWLVLYFHPDWYLLRVFISGVIGLAFSTAIIHWIHSIQDMRELDKGLKRLREGMKYYGK